MIFNFKDATLSRNAEVKKKLPQYPPPNPLDSRKPKLDVPSIYLDVLVL